MEAYRTAYVYVREAFAGTLKETDYGYSFIYHTLSDSGRLAIELDKLIAEDPCIAPHSKGTLHAPYPHDTEDAQINLIADCLLM